MKNLVLIFALTAALVCRLQAGAPELIDAVRGEDVFTLLVELRQGTSPNVADNYGRSALELAARAGNFEMCKFHLWHGANPVGADGEGFSKLTPETDGEPNVVGHLLRAYAFLRKICRPGVRVKQPELALIYEPLVDYDHPKIRPHYYVNEGEKSGRKGVDDDGNGFVDDVYGWGSVKNAPFEITGIQRKAIKDALPDASTIAALYNKEALRSPGEPPEPAWLALQRSYKNPLGRVFGEHEGNSDADFFERFVSLSHGTHVAGIILKQSQNKAKLHTVSWESFGEREWVSDGIALPQVSEVAELVQSIQQQLRPHYVKKGMRGSDYVRSLGPGVINASMGLSFEGEIRKAKALLENYESTPVDLFNVATELYFYSSIPYAITGAENPDTLFVVAAGNEDEDNDKTLQSPAYLSRYFPQVIAVAAATRAGKATDFSNYGKRSVNIGAPGRQILSHAFSMPDVYMDGTSMATPAVAGCAALLRSQYPKLTAAKIRRIIENSGDISPDWREFTSSSATLNAERALQLAAENPDTLAQVGLALASNHSRESNPEALADALDYTARAVVLKPNVEEIWWSRAAVLDMSGFSSDALTAIEKARALNSKSARIWRSRGIILQNLGRHAQALESYTSAIAILRAEASEQLNNALITRARLLAKMGRTEEARKDLGEVIASGDEDIIPGDLEALLE